MDPLAHTLVGANLAATRLGDTTRFAAAALVIGANAPDIDAITYFMDRDLALGFRRGWTHGVLALFVLPLLQTGLLLLIDRIRPNAERRADWRWLLALSALATATHPFLDWLNTYGMRWLMPFDPTWFYGDAVNIADPWIWLVLGGGWLLGRRPTIGMFAVWGFFTILVIRMVAGRSPEYLPLIITIAGALLAALLWRTPSPGRRSVAAIANTALILVSLYIGSRLAISGMTEADVRQHLANRGIGPVRDVMTSPHPIDPRRWEFVAETDERYHHGTIVWPGGGFELGDGTLPVAKESAEWATAREASSIGGFITWVRYPSYEIERANGDTRVLIYNARRLTRGRDNLRPEVVEIDAGGAIVQPDR